MSTNKGVALLLALWTLAIVAMLLVVALQLSTTDLQIVANHELRARALYIADAGIEYAVSRLKNSKANFSQNMTFPAGSGHSYSVTYTSSSSTISSTGTLSSGEAVSLEVKVSVTGSAPYQVKILSWREV
ncbi:MAG: hypothetical protein V1863_02135 [Candidatus Omnitrophota bacterium]